MLASGNNLKSRDSQSEEEPYLLEGRYSPTDSVHYKTVPPVHFQKQNIHMRVRSGKIEQEAKNNVTRRLIGRLSLTLAVGVLVGGIMMAVMPYLAMSTAVAIPPLLSLHSAGWIGASTLSGMLTGISAVGVWMFNNSALLAMAVGLFSGLATTHFLSKKFPGRLDDAGPLSGTGYGLFALTHDVVSLSRELFYLPALLVRSVYRQIVGHNPDDVVIDRTVELRKPVIGEGEALVEDMQLQIESLAELQDAERQLQELSDTFAAGYEAVQKQQAGAPFIRRVETHVDGHDDSEPVRKEMDDFEKTTTQRFSGT